jgi:hypothetical protein
MRPASASMAAATANRASLCSDSQTSCGTAPTSAVSAAPAPSATSAAGSAQQISVPVLVKIDSSAVPRAASMAAYGRWARIWAALSATCSTRTTS